VQLGSKGVQSEINVTPLIDVVLVLLIIFMVVVPLVESRFILALPESDIPPQELPEEEDKKTPLLVHLSESGVVSLNDEVLTLDQLNDKLRKVLRRRQDKVVFFDADPKANFGFSVDVMDLCRGAGARHIGVVEVEADASELPLAPSVGVR